MGAAAWALSERVIGLIGGVLFIGFALTTAIALF